MRKRGLSPIIASILLLALVIILASIIFFWARGFLEEEIQKMGRPAEQVCDDVRMSVERYSEGIDIINTGNIPIHGVNIKKIQKGKSSIETETFDPGISAGKSTSLTVSLDGFERIIVIPVIMGEMDEQRKLYTCDENTGEVI
jgi:flagellin-like protein